MTDSIFSSVANSQGLDILVEGVDDSTAFVLTVPTDVDDFDGVTVPAERITELSNIFKDNDITPPFAGTPVLQRSGGVYVITITRDDNTDRWVQMVKGRVEPFTGVQLVWSLSVADDVYSVITLVRGAEAKACYSVYNSSTRIYQNEAYENGVARTGLSFGELRQQGYIP